MVQSRELKHSQGLVNWHAGTAGVGKNNLDAMIHQALQMISAPVCGDEVSSGIALILPCR